MEQDNFRKLSTCHRFSEIFQWLINRRRNANSCIFRQIILKMKKYKTNISQA